MTTAPRLRTLLPDVAVQRARWRVPRASGGVDDSGVPVGSTVMGSPPWGRSGTAGRGRRVRAGGRVGGREMTLVAATQLGTGLPDRVLERVGERGGRGRDDVGVAAHRRPGPGAIHRVDHDARPGGGCRVPVQDADLVVDQMDLVDAR